MARGYIKPRRINSVSVSMLLFMGLLTYLGFCAWPVLSLNSNVKSELDDFLPRAYRMNLYPEPTRTQALNKLRAELIARIKTLPGMEDPRFETVIKGDKKTIAIEVKYQTDLVLIWLDKHVTVNFSPSVSTDAARVQWD